MTFRDPWKPDVSLFYDRVWLSPPVPTGPVHCSCEPCPVKGCGSKPESQSCQHGEMDSVCDHRFCPCGAQIFDGDICDACVAKGA